MLSLGLCATQGKGTEMEDAGADYPLVGHIAGLRARAGLVTFGC